MPFNDFLSLVKVIKMLYGSHIATIFFEKNIENYYKLILDDLNTSKKKREHDEVKNNR